LTKYLLPFLVFASVINAQISMSMDSLLFPQQVVNTTSIKTFYVINRGPAAKTVYVSHKNMSFIVDTAYTIPSNDSIAVNITYKPVSNIYDYDLVFFTTADQFSAAVIKCTGSGKYGDNYDVTTFNKFDNELKTALTALVNNHTSLGYNTARDKMFETIDDYGGDTIECVYSGKRVKAADRTTAQNLGFNTEHTWPQSNFSENEPMRSDLFHLYPTDDVPNNRRSNYSFGYVVGTPTYENNGSKLGNDSTNSIVFEPRNVHKGNVSRSMFYFIIRYPSNYGTFFTAKQERAFRVWNKLDLVDAREMLRNTRVESFQHKRNPFIDHPDFADRIYSFITTNTTPQAPLFKAVPVACSFDSTNVSDTSYATVYVNNPGNSLLTVNSMSVNSMQFKIVNTPASIDPSSYKKVTIMFVPDSNLVYNSNLTISTNAGSISIPVTGIGKKVSTNVENNIDHVSEFKVYQNYPNPFNASTVIKYYINNSGFVSVKLYDILGNEVKTMFSGNQNQGEHEILFNGNNLSTGIYFYIVKTGNTSIAKRMLMLK